MSLVWLRRVQPRGRTDLAALSVDHLDRPVDESLSHMCRGINGRRGIDCCFPLLASLVPTGELDLSLKTRILRAETLVSFMRRDRRV